MTMQKYGIERNGNLVKTKANNDFLFIFTDSELVFPTSQSTVYSIPDDEHGLRISVYSKDVEILESFHLYYENGENNE